MPELRFRYDPSLALGSRTLTVLREVAPVPDPSGEGSEGREGRHGREGRGEEDDDGAQT